MAHVHGKNTIVKLGATDLSIHTNNTEFERGADEHDMTTYGKNDHVVKGGLGTGKTTMSGKYDSTAVSGPRALIEPLVGTNVSFTFQPEGTGAGKPQSVVTVLVKSYKETAPVADYIMWSAELTHSDAVNRTAQS
jgi:hypothetical protein